MQHRIEQGRGGRHAAPAHTTLAGLAALATLGTLGALPQAALAQGKYPDKAVRLVIPFAAGGSTDVMGRLFASRMGPILGQPIVVDLKPGGGGAIGMAEVARARPDGYTIIYGSSSTHVITPATSAVTYDPLKDFSHISLATNQPIAIAVNMMVPARTLKEFIAHARANPGKVNYGSAGTGSTTHIAGEMFNKLAGTTMTHIPYKGGGNLVTDMISDRIQWYPGTTGGMIPLANSGKARVLAVTSEQRMKSAPDIPTAREQGVDMVFGLVTLFSAPAGTPKAALDALYDSIQKPLNDPAFQGELLKQGFEPMIGYTPEKTTAHVKFELSTVGPLAKQLMPKE